MFAGCREEGMRRILLIAWVLFLALGFFSCSKQGRAKRLVDASESAYGTARGSLLSGDSEAFLKSAQLAKALAGKAAKLVPSGPGADRIASQAEKCSWMASLGKDPTAVIQFWRLAITEEDWDLVLHLFNWRSLMERSFAKRLEGMSDEGKRDLEEVFHASCEKTFKMYKDILSIWQLEGLQSEETGDEAMVRCEMNTPKGIRGIGFWLHRREGMWIIFDFTIGRTADDLRFTRSLQELDVVLGDGVDLAQFLKGKGLLEAFSEVQQAHSMNPFYLKKPWLNQYVRLVSEVSLMQAGKEVRLEPGRILKVIDQDRDPDGVEHVIVRTPDADPVKSASGKIPVSSVEYMGTDESEMWGTEASIHGP